MNRQVKSQIKTLVDNLNDTNKEQTLSQIKSIMDSNNFSDRTITVYYSQIKNMFKKVSGDKDFLNKIKPDDELTKSVLEKNLLIKNDRREINVPQQMLEDINVFGTQIKGKEKVIELVIWLMLMSGRRISEIYDGTFYVKKGEKGIFFKGIKKTKGKKEEEEIKLKLLCNKTKFIRNYKIFKRIVKGRKLLSINQSTNRKIKQLWGEQFSSHSMRGIYINYLYKFRNPDKLKKNTYIMKYLNHEVVETSMNYTQYDLNNNHEVNF